MLVDFEGVDSTEGVVLGGLERASALVALWLSEMDLVDFFKPPPILLVALPLVLPAPLLPLDNPILDWVRERPPAPDRPEWAGSWGDWSTNQAVSSTKQTEASVRQTH